MTRINAASAAVDKPNPSIFLMAVVSRVASKTDFKVALKRDLPIDLVEFYHEAERYLCQEDGEPKDTEITIIDDRDCSEWKTKKNKGKKRGNDDFGEPKRQK